MRKSRSRCRHGPWLLRAAFPGAYWTAIEIWEPYVEAFGLTQKYDKVIVHDVRRMEKLPDADLYIFGDVPEHMPPDEATSRAGPAS
jgi:hypothetical protein